MGKLNKYRRELLILSVMLALAAVTLGAFQQKKAPTTR